MPSIFTHLLIAEDALASLPLGPLRERLEADREAYFLGALGPDLPYFDIFHSYRGMPVGPVLGPVSHGVESRILAWLGWSLPADDGWARRLHGAAAEQSIARWQAWAWGRRRQLTAFLAGQRTHVAADEVLHPKVFADGGVTDTAEGRRRHRDIEINLDLVLLRLRGVALESLSLNGLLETFLGRVDQRGEYLSPAVKAAWADCSAACGDAQPLRRQELDAWSRGFAGAMRLLEHRFSPLRQAQDRFVRGAEERWRTFLAREQYLASHVPRALRAAQRALEATPGAERSEAGAL